MVKKKKTQLKPVARGFATTSVPKKAVPEDDAEGSTSAAGSLEEDVQKADNGPASCTPPPQAQTDDFDPSKAEEQSLQNLVDRLQLTTEKDIVRTVKVHQVDTTYNILLMSSYSLSK
jgi:ATP-dependent RNA helicase DHX29